MILILSFKHDVLFRPTCVHCLVICVLQLAAEKSNASQIKQLHDREVQKVDALKLDRDMLLKNISEERSLSEKLRVSTAK